MSNNLTSLVDPHVVEVVVFDVYGTLLEIHARRPYRRLFEEIKLQVPGLTLQEFARGVMTAPRSLLEAANHYQVRLDQRFLADLEAQLQSELESVQPFDDSLRVLDILRGRGFRIGLCSNLAQPYVEPARAPLASRVDLSLWSCEVGLLKPDPALFLAAARNFNVAAGRCLMVGDNMAADVEGARSAGMQAIHLTRDGNGPISTLDCLVDLLVNATSLSRRASEL